VKYCGVVIHLQHGNVIEGDIVFSFIVHEIRVMHGTLPDIASAMQHVV
jgi:hypothetical protein